MTIEETIQTLHSIEDMTREEQILNKAIDYSEIEENFLEYDDCGDVCDDKTFIEKAFIEGAKWADENPKEGLVSIDKVCEYLDNALYEVVSGISGLPDVMSIENTTMEDFIKNFRKAMEE